MTNEKLYWLCRKYGHISLMARRKFEGLLPEVFKRKLYLEKGYESIYEFAAKLAGMSRDRVAVVLNLERRFQEMPTLKSLLETGEVSVNKLARIVSVATAMNEGFWAEKVQLLSQPALETLVRDERAAERDGFNKPLNQLKSLRPQISSSRQLDEATYEFDLDADVREELNQLSAKGIDVSEIIRQALKARREKIEQKKEGLAQEPNVAAPRSRHIPVKVERILEEEHGKKCSMPYCSKPADVIHHTQRFSMSQNHDPRYLAPLCKSHHAIAHSVDQSYLNFKANSHAILKMSR